MEAMGLLNKQEQAAEEAVFSPYQKRLSNLVYARDLDIDLEDEGSDSGGNNINVNIVMKGDDDGGGVDETIDC
jgi:hypothetical protein